MTELSKKDAGITAGDVDKYVAGLLQFIEKSPEAFHAVSSIKELLMKAGYAEIKETEQWNIIPGGKYFVIRNSSSIAAFHIPTLQEDVPTEPGQGLKAVDDIQGFHIVAAHSDSPTFKVKEKPEIKVEEQYIKLNTEKYGGMIMSTWLDRPLSVAGRLVVRRNGDLIEVPVNVDRDLLVIPNVAIHMNRDMNKGVEYNAQTDMLPLYGAADGNETFMDTVAAAAGVETEEILAHDLFLYVRDKGCRIGACGEFILSPRLDDLQCVYAAVTALTESVPHRYINVGVVFDNEEVGSGTRQGADSTFLEDVLMRITEALGKNTDWFRRKVSDSLLISADNAHAVHPNHPEKADPTNRPYLNGGIVIKYHGSQRYTTDAFTAAVMKELCGKAGVPVQTYTNRSDIAGGSTLGNISTAHVSLPSVDIGLPQLAMHSAVETAGSKDTFYAIEMMKAFWAE